MTTHLDALEQYLHDARWLYGFSPIVHGGGGHGGKFAIVFDGGVAAFCKPASGVGDGGLATRNEVAAWAVARLLGWQDLLGATVLRLLPGPASGAMEEMAVQVLWPGSDFTPDVSHFSTDETWRAALFDYVVLHSDRANNNWLGVPPTALPFPGAVLGSSQQLKLIDHGYAFDYPGRQNVNSSFVDRHRGQQIPDPLVVALAGLIASVPGSILPTLLDGNALSSMEGRINQLVSSRTLA